MVFLNQNQLLGNLIPDVLISKITLETAGGSPSLKEDNPHIDLNKTPSKNINPLTGKSMTPRISADLASKNLFEQTPYSGPSEKLIVTLDLTLKEKLDNGLVGTWFKNNDFKKYLRLKVVQCTRPEITKALSNDGTLLFSISRDNIISSTHNKLIEDYLILSNFLSVKDNINMLETMKIVHSSIEEKSLNVQSDIVGDKSNITQHYSETDNDGNTISTFVFRTKFQLDVQNPEHLSYFAFSYLDLKQLAKDFKMKLDSRMLLQPYGKIVSDIVFENGQTVDESYVYLDDDGLIWVGHVEETEDGETFGITTEDTRIRVTKTLIGNSKLQDARNFDDIERLFLDFSVIENEILNVKLDGPRRDKLDIVPQEPPFTDFNIAQDEDGNVRFLFGLNFRKILALNAYYGKLFSNSRTGRVAVNDSSIVTMKIYRRRVKGSPEVGSSYDIKKFFDENQVDDLIAISGEKTYKQFITVDTPQSSLRELNDIFIKENSPTKDLIDMRYFTGVDKTTDDITDGYYIYGAEVEIEDASLDFIKNRIIDLRTARFGLEEYLAQGSKLDSTVGIVSNNDPHIDFPGETKVDKGTKISGNFNPLLNRFTQKFIDEQRALYDEDNLDSPWVTAVERYIEILKLFVSNADQIPFDKFEKSLLFFTHPATGNPSGIIKLAKLMETLETTLSKVSGEVVLPNSSVRTSHPTVSSSSKVPIKTFKIMKFFKNVYNSSYPKTIGYDFLDVPSAEKVLDGLLTVTGEEYAERVEREINHYFIQNNGQKPNINIKVLDQEYTKADAIDNTSFSYLTPAKINFTNMIKIQRLGNSPTPLMNSSYLSNLDLSIKQFNTMLVPNRSYTSPTFKSFIDTNFQQVSHNLINMFAKINVYPFLKTNEATIPMVNIPRPLTPTKRSPVTIDPIVEDKSKCDLGNDEIQKINSDTNPTPVLLDIVNKMDAVKPTNSSTASKNVLSFASKSNLINGETLSVKMFDLYSPENLLSKAIQTNAYKSDMFFQGYPHNTTIEDAVMSLPNQIKSLYLSRTSPSIVRYNVFQKPVDVAKDSQAKSEFRLNYRMINVVQVFNGYEISSDGEMLLRKPLWTPLTLDIYNKSIGKNLLCRLRTYENKAVGIIRDKSLELPVYNEYFVIKAERSASANVVRRPSLPPPLLRPIKIESAKQTVVRTELTQTNTVQVPPPKAASAPQPKSRPPDLPKTGQALNTATKGQVSGVKGMINLPIPRGTSRGPKR